MKLTNKLGLPQPFVDAVTREYTYVPRRYSVTALLKGVCQTTLERRYGDKVEQDVSDMIWSIFGSAVHSILEHAQEGDNQIKENKIVIPIGNGYYELSGIFDLYDADTKTVTDYKTVSVWKVIRNEWEDYRKQLLMYAYMLRKIGFECENGEIVAIMKDHSKTKAKTDHQYPPQPVQKVTFHFTDEDFKEIEDFINKRFEELDIADTTPDKALEPCTPEERWQTETKYAVRKKGRKSAIRLCSSMEEAHDYMEAKGFTNGAYFVEIRKGENKKCEDYCSVNNLCPFYQALKKKEEEFNGE